MPRKLRGPMSLIREGAIDVAHFEGFPELELIPEAVARGSADHFLDRSLDRNPYGRIVPRSRASWRYGWLEASRIRQEHDGTLEPE